YPFILDDFTSTEKSIASLSPYQTKIIKYTLRIDELAKNDTYELEFIYTRDGTDSSNIEKYYIDVRSTESIVDLVSNTSPKLSIGKESEINLKIKNLGSVKVKDVFITLNNSSDDVIKVQNLNTIYIESLNVLEEKDIEFSLIALNTATKKSYTLPITIKYSDSNSTNTVSRDLGVQIIDNPNIVIGVSQIGNNNTGKLIANTKEKIEVEIYNTGNVDAESVYVELIGDKVSDNFTKYFIGSIEKDNYDSALAEFNIKDVSSGKYPLTINVYYKDSSLEEQVISKTINLEIENKTKQNGFTSIISILLFIVIGIVAISVLVLVLRWMFLKIVKPAFCTIFHITQKVSQKQKKN
ncbi:MAG: hypothetical protein V1824_03145, partial [archaeon]